MYPRELIDEVILRNDIVDVISEYVDLKKAGKNFKALCPFHKEKTPSFVVSPEKQLFHCFGCGKGGNVVTFVMEIEHISFYEAIKKLAARAGVKLVEQDAGEERERSRIQRLYSLNYKCAQVFHELLLRNVYVLGYLEKRGLDRGSIDRFLIGWASKKELLWRILEKSGFSREEMEESGVFGLKGGSEYYLRFDNRVVFPIFTASGKVIGFGGRVVGDAERVAKYINTPETSIFSKRRVLYGINLALPGIRRSRKVVIVEGYMDVIALHRSGIDYTVASLGTSLTREQVRRLVGSVDIVYLAYDSDVAGRSATLRALQLVMDKGVDVKIIRISEGKDPDEFLRHHTKQEWLELEDEAISFEDYIVESISERKELGELDERKVIEEFVSLLDAFDDVKRERMIKRVSQVLDLNEGVLRGVIHKKMRKKVPGYVKDIDIAVRSKLDKYGRAERELLWLMLVNPGVRGMVKEVEKKVVFADEVHSRLADYLLSAGMWLSEEEIVEELRGDSEISTVLSDITWRELPPEDIDVKSWAEELISILQERTKERRLQELHKYMEEGKVSPSLLKEYTELRKSMRR
ncbi:MAG: DNA primase [Synergistetes bacterium]|nr:DNA primase [Synergistota bacterium]